MVKEIKNGRLYFDGCDTVELAKNYGTPVYVMSQTDIEDKMNAVHKDFLDKYPNTHAAFASKAFCTTAMLKICEKNGFSIDVVSGGELFTAIKAGFPGKRIEFNGNNKQLSEIEMAVDYGVGTFIIDGLQEIPLIEKVCKEKGKKVNAIIRITPGVAASTHDYIVTGKKDSKFGVPLDDDVFFPLVKQAIDSEYINFRGLHMHIGSQLFENDAFVKATNVLVDNVAEIKKRFGADTYELNVGGGFGAIYINEERKPYSFFLDPIMETIYKRFDEMGMARPEVGIEPGRSIVAEAGITLYTVGQIKDVKGIRKYVAIDGGMYENIRPALYQAEYTGVVANKADEAHDQTVTLCGKCCESGDIIIQNAKVPGDIEAGDIFATYSTGAYGFSMASNYNSNPTPGVVLVHNGKSAWAVKPQTYEQLMQNQEIPADIM